MALGLISSMVSYHISNVCVFSCIMGRFLFSHIVAIFITNNVLGNPAGPVGQTGDRTGITNARESPVAHQIWRNGKEKHGSEPFLCSYFVEWYDDLDPNSSIKGNRGGVWVKTVTFGASNGQRNSLFHTYIVACGPKDASHEAVEAAFLEDVKKLSTEKMKFYSKAIGGAAYFHIESLVTLADQLARRESNCISHGNGKYTARWGYSADLCYLTSVVLACDNCLSSMFDGEQPPFGSCGKCTNWSLDVDSDLLNFPPPPKFPQEMIPASGYLRPRKITYDSLATAATIAHEHILSGRWNQATAIAFLKPQGFNNDTSSRIVEAGINTKLYNE